MFARAFLITLIAFVAAPAMLILVLLAFGLLLVFGGSSYTAPGEAEVRKQFEEHKPAYARFVALLHQDPSARFIDCYGDVGIDRDHKRVVPAYRRLLRDIDAKFVTVWRDGSIHFTLAVNGGSIASMSYVGVRYVPRSYCEEAIPRRTFTPVLVDSLDVAQKKLWDRPSKAEELYVVPIEPRWFVFCDYMN